MVAFLVAARADVVWFAVAQLIPPALQLLIQGAAAMRHISVRPVFAPREAADLLRESLPLIGFLVVGLLYCRADGVILSLLSTHSEVGVYGLAFTIAFNTIVVSLVFLKSTLSTATELFARDVAAFAGFLRRSVELMYFVAVPVAVVGALLAGPLIGLFGDQAFVARGTPTLALLFVAAALRFVSGTLGQGLVASHHQRILFWLTIATLVLNVALNVALAGRFGAVGPGVALVCTEFFNMVISSWWLRRQLRLPYAGDVLAAGAGTDGSECRGDAAALGITTWFSSLPPPPSPTWPPARRPARCAGRTWPPCAEISWRHEA